MKKNSVNNTINNLKNNIKNNLNLKIQKVPLVMDIVSVVLIVMLVIMLGSGKHMPEETKVAFLLGSYYLNKLLQYRNCHCCCYIKLLSMY